MDQGKATFGQQVKEDGPHNNMKSKSSAYEVSAATSLKLIHPLKPRMPKPDSRMA